MRMVQANQYLTLKQGLVDASSLLRPHKCKIFSLQYKLISFLNSLLGCSVKGSLTAWLHGLCLFLSGWVRHISHSCTTISLLVLWTEISSMAGPAGSGAQRANQASRPLCRCTGSWNVKLIEPWNVAYVGYKVTSFKGEEDATRFKTKNQRVAKSRRKKTKGMSADALRKGDYHIVKISWQRRGSGAQERPLRS